MGAYMVCVGQTEVHASRSNILRLIYHPFEGQAHEVHPFKAMQSSTDASGKASTIPSPQDSLLRDFPEGSLEFQILHEMVRREARARLEQTMQQLAGRESDVHRTHDV